MNTRYSAKSTTLRCLAMTLLAGGLSHHVAAQTWTGTTDLLNWSDTTRWNPATVPNATSATAVIDGTSSGANITVDGIFSVGQLTLSRDVTLAASANPLHGFTLANGASSPVISTTGTVSIATNLFGTNGFTKQGAGALVLTAANTYTGTTTISAGTLRLSGGNDRIRSGNTVTFSGAATLDLTSTQQTLNTLNLSATSTATIQGATGALILNGTGTYTINPTVTGTSLDMSGLKDFTFNRTANSLMIQANGNNVINTVNLAKTGTNTIAASSVTIGQGGSAIAGQQTLVNLGQNNVFSVGNTLLIGTYQNANSVVAFQSGLTAPTLTLRGSGGGSTALPNLLIGYTNSGAVSSTGTLNMTNGSIDAIATRIELGSQLTNAGTGATGTLTMPAGTVVAETLYLARKSNVAGTSVINGTVNQSGGTITADTVYFGTNEGTTSQTFNATYNLTGGTLFSNTLLANGAVFAAASTRTLNLNGGNLQNKAGGNLSVSGIDTSNGGRLRVVVGASNGTITADANQSVSLANTAYVSGAGTLVKAGAGSLILDANTAGFTGTLRLDAGDLKLGTGTTAANVALINFIWNAGVLTFDLSGASASDRLTLTGTGAFTKGSGSTFAFDFSGGGQIGGSYTLASFVSTSFTQSDFSATNLGSGLIGSFALGANSLVLNISAIPEPSTYAALVGLASLGVVLARRRRSSR